MLLEKILANSNPFQGADIKENKNGKPPKGQNSDKQITDEEINNMQIQSIEIDALSELEKHIFRHCTEAVPIKEMKKWIKSIV